MNEQPQSISLADLTRREDLENLKRLTGGKTLPPSTPEAGVFNDQEVAAINLYASMTRNGVTWITDEAGRRIGYTYESSDAWCE